MRKASRASEAVAQVLSVPFAGKDRVKALGARWSQEMKRWYVPAGICLKPFGPWIDPKEEGLLYKASAAIFVAESSRECWKCARRSLVVTLGLELSENNLFEDFPILLLWEIFQMPGDLKTFMSAKYPRYYLDFSKTVQESYFMNHCEHCGAKFGDWHVHHKPEGGFIPHGPEEAGKINFFTTNLRTCYRIMGNCDEAEVSFEGFDCGWSTQAEMEESYLERKLRGRF